jgi:hypothetical protein
MKIMKSWPFEVPDDYEKQFPPLGVWLPRVAIVSLVSGLAGALIVLFGLHYF